MRVLHFLQFLNGQNLSCENSELGQNWLFFDRYHTAELDQIKSGNVWGDDAQSLNSWNRWPSKWKELAKDEDNTGDGLFGFTEDTGWQKNTTIHLVEKFRLKL